MADSQKAIEKSIELVDKRLDSAIFDRKTETNAIRAEVKLTTRELSMEISEMKKDLEQVSKDVCGVKQDIKNLDTKLDEKFATFFQEAERKFASKLTEKIVYGMVGTILSAVLLALIYLVVK
jgi:flagellar motility protein MotE (MotC chaperone)